MGTSLGDGYYRQYNYLDQNPRARPFQALESDKKPIKIEAVALQWKWLFIYPDEKIATVNYLQIPVDTPIHFEITADAPMNSLWIPGFGQSDLMQCRE